MVKLFIPGGSQRSRSCWSAVGVACILGALTASCANGVAIVDEDVLFLPPGARPVEDELESPEGADDLDESAAEGSGLTPVSDETGEGNADEQLPRADQASDDEPADEQPEGEDPEHIPPTDLPISDPEPDPDPDPDGDPGDAQDPIIQPDPVPPITPQNPPSSDPADPPPATDPDPAPIPPIIDDVPLPAAGHCLGGWEGSSCDVCSGQTQSDRLSCRLYIDCYIINDCDPGTCGSIEQACGVNRVGNGLAPKEIADTVYGCMCSP
jgi:hypothetical protein